MFEFDMKAFVWLCIGAGGTIITLLMMSLCEVSGRCSRLEEQRENRTLRVENWENTPERRAMTERSRFNGGHNHGPNGKRPAGSD